MRRGNGGEERGVIDTLETINGAAMAIAAAEENRLPQDAVQKRRWRSFLSLYWCFGSHKNNKRIGHSVIVPETTTLRADSSAAQSPSQTLTIVLPFLAPPSSPASFFQSEPPSSTQSPTGFFSLSSMTNSMYSPGRPTTMFDIGPYAYETQLVTPPMFSSYATEPSTAPVTPPESAHLTTPSSPEVPFSRLLDPIQQTGETERYSPSQYEFPSYLLYPGSPVSNLISPCSGLSASGTSSPFPDEFGTRNPYFLEFKTSDHSKLLNLEKMSSREWGSQQESGTLTPDAEGHQKYNDDPPSTSYNGWQNDEIVVDHRVSFEITPEEIVRCVEKKSEALATTASVSLENAEEIVKSNGPEFCSGENSNDASEKASSDAEDGHRHKKHRSIALVSGKEFNFENIDGGNPEKSSVNSDWWANPQLTYANV